MTTSEVIKFMCQGQNISMSELARRMGQTRQNLSKKLERETLTVEEINQIAAILGGKFEQVFTLPNGMHLNTDQAEQSKSEILLKAIWNFNEQIQRVGRVNNDDIQKLIELFRSLYDIDVVYVLSISPDNTGIKILNMAVSDEKFRFNTDDVVISPEEYDAWEKCYDSEHLCDDPRMGCKELKGTALLHYGCLRENNLDGVLCCMDFDENRVWSREERDGLLRLGRMLHQYITSYRLEKLNRETKHQMDIMKSLAEVYITLHIFDIQKDTTMDLSKIKYKSDYIGIGLPASQEFYQSIYNNVTLDNRDAVMDFVNWKTLDQRMKNKKSISMEFHGIHFGWIRGQFIVVDRDSRGKIRRVAFGTQAIDAEKREMDHLKRISTTDELTDLNNRRAYEEDIRSLQDEKLSRELCVAAFDLNGLKRANDEIGHEAGDELIRGAAFCITAVFGQKGKIYRTGGDEFMCIFKATVSELKEMKKNFNEAQKAWKGEKMDTLSISAGFAPVRECKGKTLHEILIEADQRMYADKRAYYEQNGIERRKC